MLKSTDMLGADRRETGKKRLERVVRMVRRKRGVDSTREARRKFKRAEMDFFNAVQPATGQCTKMM